MLKLLKPSTMILVAVLALSLATAGTAVAGPVITVKLIKKIAKKEIKKAAPKLSVAHAKTADSATTATTAANANALGGRALAQVQTVVAGAQNASVIGSIGAGTDVVTLNYTLAAASKVNFSGVVELQGDGTTDDEAFCVIRNDGAGISLGFETTFDDIGGASSNAAVNVVLTSSTNVAAGAHVATLRCTQSAGTGAIIKDDAAINIVAVPN
jgi:hypothetical protein